MIHTVLVGALKAVVTVLALALALHALEAERQPAARAAVSAPR